MAARRRRGVGEDEPAAPHRPAAERAPREGAEWVEASVLDGLGENHPLFDPLFGDPGPTISFSVGDGAFHAPNPRSTALVLAELRLGEMLLANPKEVARYIGSLAAMVAQECSRPATSTVTP